MRTRGVAITAAFFIALVAAVAYANVVGDLPGRAAITLVVFLATVFLWIATPLNDTYVALGAALALVLTGVGGLGS